MKSTFAAAAFLALIGPMALAADLPRSTPEAQGVSASGILAFVEAADRGIESMNSLMVVRHGHVVAEGWWAPYDARSPHSLYSLSKSFTSTAVGLAIADGKLSLADPVLKYLPRGRAERTRAGTSRRCGSATSSGCPPAIRPSPG